MKFVIEQVALCTAMTREAIELLTAMGLGEWVHDHVVAHGSVYGDKAQNEADLSFNYQALGAAKELELLHYTSGRNWMSDVYPSASHFGMHVTEEQLNEWREFFYRRGIGTAQEVRTSTHTNPTIAGKRWYHYVIFNTRSILGVDIKFIVRRNEP